MLFIKAKVSYNQPCTDPSVVCNADQGLVCPTITSTGCNCPITIGIGSCDCLSNKYWNGTYCGNC